MAHVFSETNLSSFMFKQYICMDRFTQICPFSKSKFSLYEAHSLTVSTLLYRLVPSIELGTVPTGTRLVDPARKFKCTTAARSLAAEHITNSASMYMTNSTQSGNFFVGYSNSVKLIHQWKHKFLYRIDFEGVLGEILTDLLL